MMNKTFTPYKGLSRLVCMLFCMAFIQNSSGKSSAMLTDTSPPQITYSALQNASASTRTLTAVLTDETGVGVGAAVLYYKKGESGTYNKVTGSMTSGTTMDGTWSFIIDHSIPAATAGDTIYYFVAAQDVLSQLASEPAGALGSDPNNISTYPATPNKYVIVGGISGTFMIGASQTAPHYTTVTQALNDIATMELTGSVTLLLQSDYNAASEASLPLTFKPYLSTNSAFTVTLKPDAGVNALIYGASPTAIFKFTDNAKNYIVDGSNNGTGSRNLFITNTTTPGTAVIFEGLTDNQGVKNCTLKNTVIKGAGNLGNFIGVLIGAYVNSQGSSGKGHANLVLSNNNIYNCNEAIVIRGVSAADKVKKITIEGNQIGIDSVGLSIRSYGVFASNADSLLINNNRIYNFRSLGVRMGGVWFDQNVTNSTIRSNVITGINSTAISGVYSAYGINFESAGNNNDSIINNSISDISTQISGNPTSAIAAGIRIAQAATNLKIYFNSIYLTGQTSATTSYAFFYNPLLISGADISNNIFSNEITSNSAAAKHYAFHISTGVSGITFDYNVFSANSAQGILMYFAAAEYNTISEIRTGTTSNFNSVSADPLFNSFNNLVPKPGSPALLAGTTIPGLLVDIKNVTRGSSPTIGAYETAADISGPTITYAKLTNTTNFNSFTTTSFAAITDISGVDVSTGTKPRLYYKKHSDANVFGANTSVANGWKWVESASNASPFDFTFDYSLLNGGAVAAGDSVFYFIVAQDLLGQVNDLRGLRATSVSAIISAPDKPDAYIMVGPPLTGTYTVGNGGTYATLTRAATDIYLRGLQGDVKLEIVSNITESGPVVIEQWREFGVGGYRLDIVPSASNAVGDTIFCTVASRGVLELLGTDRVTIDGRINGAGNFLTFVNNATTNTQYGIRVMSQGVNVGATDNVIRNVNVRLNSTLFPSAAAIISEGDNNHNLRIHNNNISRAGTGIYITATNFPAGNHIGVVVSDNTIGGNGNQNNIGTIGMMLTYTPEVQVMRNHIFNVNGAQFAGSIGIQLGAYTSKANISQNKIHDIVNSYYDAMYREAGLAAGILINSPTTTDGQLIANNGIYRVTNASFISNHNTQNPFGIYIGGGNAHRIIHNSVYLYGAAVPPSTGTNATLSAALMINTASKNLVVQNNIFANGFKGTPGSKIYSVYANANSSFAIIENNNYDTTGADSLGLIGFKGSNALTLGAWRALTGQDQSSVCVATPFTSATDLSISSGSTPTALESGALLLSAVNTDFNNEVRPKILPTTYAGNTAPDIGAYEFDGAIADLVAPVIQYTIPKVNYNTISQTITAVITDQGTGVNVITATKPRVYYKKKNDANAIVGNTFSDNGWKYTEATNAASPFSFTIDYSILNGGTAAVNDTILYFITAQDMATTPNTGAKPGKDFVAGNVNAITVLPTNPEFYFISSPALNGVYTVGTGLSNSYPTITAALSDLAIRGVSGPVVFELTDADYSSAETFPLVISEIAGTSATNTVTIRPATGVSPMIYGNTQEGILKIADKVQHFILDGSNNAGSGRDLMINNTSTQQAPVIRLEGLSISGGVKNVIIKNTRIKGGSSTSGIGIFIGGATVNFNNSGTGEGHNNIRINNNNIYACNAALVANGTSNSKVKYLSVTDNDIGTDTVGLYNRQYGVYLRNTDNASITKNKIFNQKTTDGVNCSGVEILEGTSNSMIGQNTISGIHATNIIGYGAYGINISSGVNVSNDSLSNNMISDLLTSNSSVTSTSANAFGIRINGGDGLKIFHNTVNLSGQPVTGNAASASAALLIVNTGYPNSDIRNNIFTNSMTGAVAGSKHYAFWTNIAPLTNTLFNYNNFYVSGTHGVLMNRIGSDITTLSALKAATAANANSQNVAINYINPTDLRLTGASNGDVALAGTPIVSVNYDIDNNTRSATDPYMGVHEASIPLPVQMVSFKAILQGEDVLLTWATASEINNQGFVIERSHDNIAFERIGFEKGAGNSNVTRNYIYTDKNAFGTQPTGDLYYRLVQTDLNGAETRSEVQLVTRQGTIKDVIEAYPNPFTAIVQLRIPESYSGVIEVTDIQGRVVINKNVSAAQAGVIVLNMDHLDAGIYFLKQIGANHKMLKLVKSK